MIASEAGGVAIEEVAASTPEKSSRNGSIHCSAYAPFKPDAWRMPCISRQSNCRKPLP